MVDWPQNQRGTTLIPTLLAHALHSSTDLVRRESFAFRCIELLSIRMLSTRMENLPHELLIHVLSNASITSLIRATMVCHSLRAATEEVALGRVENDGIILHNLEESTYSYEQTPDQLLPALFVSDLEHMLRRLPSDWEDDPSFLCFRLLENDVIEAVEDESALLIYNSGSASTQFDAASLKWMHHVDDYYNFDGCDAYDYLEVRARETLWHDTYDASRVMTKHLHSRYASDWDFFRDVCDESAIAYNPHGGKLLLWRHRAVGKLFRCTLCFYDALAQSSLGA